MNCLYSCFLFKKKSEEKNVIIAGGNSSDYFRGLPQDKTKHTPKIPVPHTVNERRCSRLVRCKCLYFTTGSIPRWVWWKESPSPDPCLGLCLEAHPAFTSSDLLLLRQDLWFIPVWETHQGLYIHDEYIYIVWRVCCRRISILYANSTLVMLTNPLSQCPRSLSYANQFTGAL